MVPPGVVSPVFPCSAPLYPALRALEVAGGGLRKKGIRGAGSVVRSALSFGRHSRQPFGRGLAPLQPLPHPLGALLLGALTAPAPLHSTGLPSTAPPGLFRVPHCASVSDACVTAQTAVCATRKESENGGVTPGLTGYHTTTDQHEPSKGLHPANSHNTIQVSIALLGSGGATGTSE